ncbi:MAG: hypothetical protein ABIV06_09170 [Thermoanaerobaculia bacterium]
MTAGRQAAAGFAESYQRLPGRSWGLLGRTSLWQGKDHILLVQSRGYSESYRRFYFGEIQALILRRTSRSRNGALVLLGLALLLFAAALLGTSSASLLWLIPGVPIAIALVVLVLGGPSCTVHVRTAIETSELSALCRVRSAERSLARISALVEEIQGAATVADIALLGDSATTSAPPIERSRISPESSPPPLPAQHPFRRHFALFVLLLFDAALSAAQVWAPGQVVGGAAVALGLAELLLAIFALVEGRRLKLDARLSRVTVAALVYVCAAFVASWIGSIIMTMKAVAAGTLLPGTMPGPSVVPWLAELCIPISLGLGLRGLWLLRRLRSTN